MSEATTDPHDWLEAIDSPEALAWVEEHNRVTLGMLEARPDYRERYERNLAILSHPDRVAWPHLHGDSVVNFWQDDEHERGILRMLPFDEWLAGSREWRTVLDTDALAADEGVNWVFGGSTMLEPPHRRALIRLSRGGADAVEIRELDTSTGQFVDGGFVIPEAKSSAAWIDADTLLVASSFGDGTMTRSGYPRSVRRWRRGTSLADATVIFETVESDLGAFVGTSRSAAETRMLIYRSITMFEHEYFLVDGDETVKLDLPLDSELDVEGDRLLVQLRSEWNDGRTLFEKGSVIELSITEYLAGERAFRLLIRPAERSAVASIGATSDALVVTLLRNVSAELYFYRLVDGTWQAERIAAPDHGSIVGVEASPDWGGILFAYSGFLQPTTMYAVDPGSAEPREIQAQPAHFDATGLVVEQLEAISSDGTRIPYFIVRREGLTLDGTTPTILYGYGGFDVPMTPGYSGLTGSGWLERGGAYVMANIRGGGEFGTTWHTAALRENRQRAFDDFIAVAEDLIARGITSPEHLGVMGGSNGGLLVGAVVTQRPELFGAAAASVPVLDMRRYHVLLAGASWVGEYGDPDNPADWEFLRAYSPYHNVSRDRRYPRILLTTSTRDDRVHPAHARKMAALMEEMGHEVYFYENTEGGHAGAAGHRQMARQMAIVHTYFAKELGERRVG
jgi:prolyl oligopeptidase